MKQPAVYLMASQRNGTLYVGVTSDLIKRDWQHRTHAVSGFTEKYDVTLLVWFEQHETMESAIAREKGIKKWNRAWKLKLIEQTNPNWLDLWPVIIGEQADFRIFDTNPQREPNPRHSRECGNPDIQTDPRSGQNPCPATQESLNPLDSRPTPSRGQALRGNDAAGEVA